MKPWRVLKKHRKWLKVVIRLNDPDALPFSMTFLMNISTATLDYVFETAEEGDPYTSRLTTLVHWWAFQRFVSIADISFSDD